MNYRILVYGNECIHEPKTDTEDKDDVEYVGLLAYVDELEAKIAYLGEKIEALRDKGYDIQKLMPYITLARRFLDKIALSLEEDEIEGVHDIILELKDLVVHIENEIHVMLKTPDEGTEIKEDETCTEEDGIETIIDIEELEGKIFYLEEKLEDLAVKGYEVSKLEPYLEAARRLLNKILSLEICEIRLVEDILADFEDIFTYVTVEADIILEHATNEGAVNFDELEEKISCLEETVECLRDKGFDIDYLIPHLHSSRLVLTEMMGLKGYEIDLMNKLLEELEDLFVYIEKKVDIMLEELGDETCGEIVEVVEEVPVYYILVIEEEVYGEFEWMVVKDFEEEFILVFEEGQIYDGFIEWMLNVEEEVCEPKDGKIYSVDEKDDETLKWVFEDAFPTSWTGPKLDGTSSGPLLMERVELAIEWMLEP